MPLIKKREHFIVALNLYTLAVNFHTTPTIILWLEAQQPTPAVAPSTCTCSELFACVLMKIH